MGKYDKCTNNVRKRALAIAFNIPISSEATAQAMAPIPFLSEHPALVGAQRYATSARNNPIATLFTS